MMDLEKLKKIAYDRWSIVERCKNKKVLELGCVNHSIEGIKSQQRLDTWLFDYLKKYSKSATGIDIDKRAVEYLTKKGYDVRFGDAQNFDLGEKFEVMVVSKLIDHLLNIEGFFESCKRHLSQNGIIIISDDNILCLPQLLIWYFKKKLGSPDSDITIKPIPSYFKHFIGKFGLVIKSIEYNFGTGNSRLFNFFKFLEKITPKVFIYDPLFYPSYIIILKHIP